MAFDPFPYSSTPRASSFQLGVGQKNTRNRAAGFSLCFHFPGQAILGVTLFLSHTQIKISERRASSGSSPSMGSVASLAGGGGLGGVVSGWQDGPVDGRIPLRHHPRITGMMIPLFFAVVFFYQQTLVCHGFAQN